jgi:hypothetical protein
LSLTQEGWGLGRTLGGGCNARATQAWVLRWNNKFAF